MCRLCRKFLKFWRANPPLNRIIPQKTLDYKQNMYFLQSKKISRKELQDFYTLSVCLPKS